MKVIRCTTEGLKLYFKTDFEQAAFFELDRSSKATRRAASFDSFQLSLVYDGPLAISKEKKADWLSMVGYAISEDHKPYYES